VAASTHRDPRSIITPDAFEVSTALLGLPLASPGRRAVALALDGVVIGIITAVTQSFALILGVVAAALFMRAGFQRTAVPGSVFGRAMRFSVGCLGVVIAVATAIVWSSFDFFPRGTDGSEAAVEMEPTGAGVEIGEAILVRAGVPNLYEDVESLDEAREVTIDFVEEMEDDGFRRPAMREILLRSVPEGATWTGDAEAFVDAVLAELEPTSASTSAPAGVDAEVEALSDREALTAYGDLLEAGSAAAGGRPAAEAQRVALERRLVGLVGADSLAALGRAIEDLEDEVEEGEDELARARAELADAEGGGLFATLRAFADELGFGFGWAALYMTVFLSWWDGQTVGKRMMRIRVVRLDGEPITWWTAFERAGGYAAGLATGLLGFAQVWWDANRQAIHDRIVGTVVIDDAAEKVIDWESAL
jgi:hypothetical protein